MILNILIIFLSSIPIIDITITKYLYLLKTRKITSLFSTYIIYFNLIVNLMLLNKINYKIIIYRYFVELFIINVCFKSLLDRPRPYDSIFKININKYYGIFDLKISKKWTINQSFPSGHVSTIYSTFYIINNIPSWYLANYFYLLLLILTIYSRINIGAHYFSDCIFAIFICNFCLSLLINV